MRNVKHKVKLISIYSVSHGVPRYEGDGAKIRHFYVSLYEEFTAKHITVM